MRGILLLILCINGLVYAGPFCSKEMLTDLYNKPGIVSQQEPFLLKTFFNVHRVEKEPNDLQLDEPFCKRLNERGVAQYSSPYKPDDNDSVMQQCRRATERSDRYERKHKKHDRQAGVLKRQYALETNEIDTDAGEYDDISSVDNSYTQASRALPTLIDFLSCNFSENRDIQRLLTPPEWFESVECRFEYYNTFHEKLCYSKLPLSQDFRRKLKRIAYANRSRGYGELFEDLYWETNRWREKYTNENLRKACSAFIVCMHDCIKNQEQWQYSSLPNRLKFAFDTDPITLKRLTDRLAHPLFHYYHPLRNQDLSLEKLYEEYSPSDVEADIEHALKDHPLFTEPCFIDDESIETMQPWQIDFLVRTVIDCSERPIVDIFSKEDSFFCVSFADRFKERYPEYNLYEGVSAFDVPNEVKIRFAHAVNALWDLINEEEQETIAREKAVEREKAEKEYLRKALEEDEISFAEEYYQVKKDRARQYKLNHHYKGSYHKALQDAARIAHIHVKKHERNGRDENEEIHSPHTPTHNEHYINTIPQTWVGDRYKTLDNVIVSWKI